MNKFIIFIFLLIPVLTKSRVNLTELYLVKEIKLIEHKRKNTIIEKPYNTFIPILRADDYCLIYKTGYPKKKKLGEIFWSQSNASDSCDSLNNFKFLESVVDVERFEYDYFYKDNFYNIKIKFKKNGALFEKIFPLINLEIFTNKKFNIFNNEKSKSFIGKKGDNYRDNTSIICHKVNKDCEDEVVNKCDKCKYGYFEVLDYKCSQGGSKYCGNSFCGEKNQPACILGFFKTAIKFKNKPCQKDNPSGFCMPGLNQFCDENNVLICI